MTMSESKKLVAYFSCSGTTERVAERIAAACGGDLFEIEPVQPYTRADLDWTDAASRTTVEKNDPSIRPEIARDVEGFEGYDVVFVGFPIWWYHEPAIIDTFLEGHDFSGKTVIPFATSGGSGMGDTDRRFCDKCPGAAAVKAGRVLNGARAAAIENRVEELGL